MVSENRSAAAGSNAERTRVHNRQVVLSLIRAADTLGRADVARAAGLSVQAVSNIIAALVQEGILIESGRISVGRGQPAPLFRLNPKGALALGFEIRPDAITAAIIDLSGKPLLTHRESLKNTQFSWVTKQLPIIKCKMLKQLALQASRLIGAGVVMPGPFNQTGLAHTPSVLPQWHSMNVLEPFQQSLGMDVVIENDANAAALAERVCGSAHAMHSYAFIYFGTGIGMGIVNDGQLFRGSTGNAGELGHLRVHLPRKSGRSGVPLESIASRLALNQRLQRAGRVAETSDALQRLFIKADAVILAWLDEAAPALSQAIHTLENLFDPETVILGGALPDALLGALIDRLALPSDSIALREHRKHPRVMQGQSGRTTAAIGAASLVINATFTPQRNVVQSNLQYS